MQRFWDNETRNVTRIIAIYAGLLLFGLICTAAASDVPLAADSSVPAATGKVHLSKDNNGNLVLKLEVKNLAKPGALTPVKNDYVVWTQARGKEPENRGVLKVNNKLEGNFEDTVPDVDFDVFITAEDNPGVQVPSGPKLLHGEIQPQ